MGTDGDPLQQLTTALDALVDADPAGFAAGKAVVALHRQLARLEAVAARAAGAFERAGRWQADGARTASALAEDCEVDHVVPFAEGGPTVVDNGRLACGFHNRSRPGATRPDRPQAPEAAEPDERGPP